MRALRPRKRRGKHVGRPPKLTLEQISDARDATEGGLQTPAGMAPVLTPITALMARTPQRHIRERFTS
jgi:hypothetical protein